MTQELLQEKCDHEAGHYVMLHHFGIAHVHKYTIVLADTGIQKGGGTSFDLVEDVNLEQDTLIGLAGMAAQLAGILARTGSDSIDPVGNARVWKAGLDDREFLRGKYNVDNKAIMALWPHALLLMEQIWPSVKVISSHLLNSEHHILYHEEPLMILASAYDDLNRYRRSRTAADPADYNRDDFPQMYPGLPFFESKAKTFARLEP